MPKLAVIYKITSPSGYIYIGQSRDYKRRLRDYKTPLCIRRQPLISRSFEKYGRDAHIFEIVSVLPFDISIIDLDNQEWCFWNFYKEAGFTMMNAKEPGRSNPNSRESIEKSRRTIIDNGLLSGSNNGRYVHDISTEQIVQLYNKGFTIKEITKILENKVDRSTIGRRLSIAGIKVKRSGKRVFCIEDNKLFESVNETARYYNTTESTVLRIIHGKPHKYKGQTFKFVNKEEL